jgi:hypothetical protein
MPAPTIGNDGYYHPSSEAEVVELVKLAASTTPPTKVRVRGSAHSVVASIYTADYDGTGEPPAGSIDVMLDKLRAIGPIVPVAGEVGRATVEVEAGCNLGRNPYDPTGTSTWENSLNLTLQRAGYALDDLGGISHQTVGGFLATGSSGGSTTYSIDDDIEAIRFVDGEGNVHEVSRYDADPSLFQAVGVSMGLLGIVTKVRFRVRKTYNIYGTQTTGKVSDAYVDFYGNGDASKPSLREYLTTTPYARLMWWPQRDFDKLQVWQACRTDPVPGFVAQPYEELTQDPRLAQPAALAGSMVYLIIGNLSKIDLLPGKLGDWLAAFQATLEGHPVDNGCREEPSAAAPAIDRATLFADIERRLATAFESVAAKIGAGHPLLAKLGLSLGGLPDWLAKAMTGLVKDVLDGAFDSKAAQGVADVLAQLMPWLIAPILGLFVNDGVQTFWDTWMCGLPMDNQIDDRLFPVAFTELWIPIERTAEVMTALRTYFAGGGSAENAYKATGSFSTEIYAAKKSPFWLSPSYGTDVVRIDVFWFELNATGPEDFYQPFFDLLAPFGFRPHWGKYLPPASPQWREYYENQLPRLGDFLALRATLDPKKLFLNPYWREHLQIV